MKAQFETKVLFPAGFEGQIEAEYNRRWEEYKKQSSGNVQYTMAKKASNNKGFVIGALCALPLLAMIVVMF